LGFGSVVILRGVAVLRDCDAIIAEDTRITSRLLAIHGISRPLLSYNDHNAPQVRPSLLAKLREGARLALVSDAGTPLVSDPGHKLVREAIAEGIAVHPIPGASAPLAALAAAGLPSDRFLFAGFLPPKPGERASTLAGLAGVPATLIFFEAPQRLAASLAAMAEVFGPRRAVVARALTKLHEEFARDPLPALAARYAAEPPRGEITVLIAPPAEDAGQPDAARLDGLLSEALAFMPVKAAAGLVAGATGASRRLVYARALALKEAGPGRDSGRGPA
jgi:16S rRNA (cytidine1402-2'-O)-methyltransferase